MDLLRCGRVWQRKGEVNKKKVYIIGIGGGTGSGKSTYAHALQQALNQEGSVILHMDDYYRDQSTLSMKARETQNYDDPHSLEVSLLVNHLQALKNGQPVKKPVYEFAQHTRSEKVVNIDPVMWIVVEGILTLSYEALLQLFDITIFVDAAADIRLIRRLTRDIKERGRTMESVLTQYLATVRPMHERYVEPSRSNAKYTVSGEKDFDTSVAYLLEHIKSLVK